MSNPNLVQTGLDALDLSNTLPKHLIPKPKLVAAGILSYTLKEIIELQALLAQQGVVLDIHTAEIQVYQFPEIPCPQSPANSQ